MVITFSSNKHEDQRVRHGCWLTFEKPPTPTPTPPPPTPQKKEKKNTMHHTQAMLNETNWFRNYETWMTGLFKILKFKRQQLDLDFGHASVQLLHQISSELDIKIWTSHCLFQA